METRLDIFKARQENLDANEIYAKQLAQFVEELAAIQESGARVRVTGYPSTSTIKMTSPDSGRVSFVTVACAPLIPVEGEPEQPWTKEGVVVSWAQQYNNVCVNIGAEAGGGYTSFSVARMSEFEILES